MATNTVILLRRRGMNYYTEAAERYLESTFAPYGWHLTFRKEQQIWTCTLRYDGSRPFLVFSAEWLADRNDVEREKLCSLLAENFKTEGKIAAADSIPVSEDMIEEITYGFSRERGAFSEPPFLTQGFPKLGRTRWGRLAEPHSPYVCAFQNYGGIAKGLTVEIAVPPDGAIESCELCSHDWRKQKNDSDPFAEIAVTAVPTVTTTVGATQYHYDFPDFKIPEGINPYSRVLRGRAGTDQAARREFYLRIYFSGSQRLCSVTIRVCATLGNSEAVITTE